MADTPDILPPLDIGTVNDIATGVIDGSIILAVNAAHIDRRFPSMAVAINAGIVPPNIGAVFGIIGPDMVIHADGLPIFPSGHFVPVESMPALIALILIGMAEQQGAGPLERVKGSWLDLFAIRFTPDPPVPAVVYGWPLINQPATVG